MNVENDWFCCLCFGFAVETKSWGEEEEEEEEEEEGRWKKFPRTYLAGNRPR